MQPRIFFCDHLSEPRPKCLARKTLRAAKGVIRSSFTENILRQSSQIFAIDAIGIEQGARNMVRGRFRQEAQNLILGVIRGVIRA